MVYIAESGKQFYGMQLCARQKTDHHQKYLKSSLHKTDYVLHYTITIDLYIGIYTFASTNEGISIVHLFPIRQQWVLNVDLSPDW